jgi:hypothetical protein
MQIKYALLNDNKIRNLISSSESVEKINNFFRLLSSVSRLLSSLNFYFSTQ